MSIDLEETTDDDVADDEEIDNGEDVVDQRRFSHSQTKNN